MDHRLVHAIELVYGHACSRGARFRQLVLGVRRVRNELARLSIWRVGSLQFLDRFNVGNLVLCFYVDFLDSLVQICRTTSCNTQKLVETVCCLLLRIDACRIMELLHALYRLKAAALAEAGRFTRELLHDLWEVLDLGLAILHAHRPINHKVQLTSSLHHRCK